MADLVSNPNIPYYGVIPGGLFPSKTIFVQGFIPNGSERFAVDLECGQDIAFHFNPRFKGGRYIVCTNRKNNKFGAEERNHHSPFQLNQNFELIIKCELAHYKIAVNGSHVLTFNHRVADLSSIKNIRIGGSVKIYSIRYEPPSAPQFAAPTQFPAAPVPPPQYQHAPQPMYPPAAQPTYPASPLPVINPPVPYLGLIPGGMRDGKIIVVKGVVKPYPNRFDINFQCGMSNNPRSDIAFHFNPRFTESTIVMNMLRSGQWGAEDRHGGYFPFFPKGSYEIMFMCTDRVFKVALNGSHLLEFTHRIPFQLVNTIGVNGDIDVTQITFN